MRLIRSHGLGNDYLVWMGERPVDPGFVRALCDRHRGPGGDGVLEPTASDRADFGVRIWNPDGSVAEKSGNGLRIFARWLVDHRSAPQRFTVDTGFDVVRCTVAADGIAVEMGRATFEPAALPLTADGPWVGHPLEVCGAALSVVALSVGNPHCVIFREEPDLDALPWRDWGKALERWPAFPNRTNVQIARVVDGGLELRIWERGAGETSASGSSSCAVAAAAVHTGRLAPGTIRLVMPGGQLSVDVSPELDLVLRGPVEVVGEIRLDPRWLAAR